MLKAKTHFRGLVNRQNHLSLVRLRGLVNHQSAHYCSAGLRGLVIWSLPICLLCSRPLLPVWRTRACAPPRLPTGGAQEQPALFEIYLHLVSSVWYPASGISYLMINGHVIPAFDICKGEDGRRWIPMTRWGAAIPRWSPGERVVELGR